MKPSEKIEKRSDEIAETMPYPKSYVQSFVRQTACDVKAILEYLDEQALLNNKE